MARPELIDSIVVCPKCQSMVQLTAPTTEADELPQPPVALGRDLVDSGAVTEDSIADLNLGGAESTLPRGFADTPAETQPPQDAESPSWQSAGSERSRKFALMVAVGLASIISLFVLISVVVRNVGKQPVAQAEDTDASQVDAESDGKPSTDVNESSADNDGAEDPDVPGDAEPAALDEPPAATDAETSAEPPTDADVATEPDEQPAEAPNDLLPKNPLLPENPLLPDNPLLPANPLASKTPVKDDDGLPEEATMRELTGDLADLFTGIRLESPQRVATGPPPPTIEQIELERAADADVAPDAVVRPRETINMRQALSAPLWLNLTNDAGYPLNDLLLFISHYTGVPIEVEWVSFDIVGQSINQPVKFPSRSMSVEELLGEICKALDAEIEIKERSIVFRPTTASFDAAVLDALNFEELGEQGVSAATAARTLLRMEPGNAANVAVPGELGRQQLTVLACDAIRTARGIETKLPTRSLTRWAGDYESQLGGWQPVGGGISGPTLIQPATFSSLVRSTARRNSVTCFIRWQDAELARLSPTDKRMPYAGDDVSAEEVLDQLLEPHGLTARSVDDQHWWIGSQASFDRFPVVVWFDDSQEPQKRFERIQAILESAGGDAGGVALDPVSGWCFAILPRFLLRQVPRVLGDELAAGE